MVVGKFKLDVNRVVFLAMIDTGSELNVTNPSFPQKANTLVDFEGAKRSLRGIHGDLEQLQGIVADAPIKIGSHFFPHHLFVSRHPIGDPWDNLFSIGMQLRWNTTGIGLLN